MFSSPAVHVALPYFEPTLSHREFKLEGDGQALAIRIVGPLHEDTHLQQCRLKIKQ